VRLEFSMTKMTGRELDHEKEVNAMPKPKSLSGSAAMQKRGLKKVESWYTQEDFDELERAATEARIKKAQIVARGGLDEARRILKEAALKNGKGK
jgi:hypothetical protein